MTNKTRREFWINEDGCVKCIAFSHETRRFMGTHVREVLPGDKLTEDYFMEGASIHYSAKITSLESQLQIALEALKKLSSSILNNKMYKWNLVQADIVEESLNKINAIRGGEEKQ